MAKNTLRNRNRLRKAMWNEYDRARGFSNEKQFLIHNRWALALARLIGYNKVRAAIPFKPDKIKKALLNGDIHLSGSAFPLRMWDSRACHIAPWSISDGIYVLKAVARHEVAKEEEK